MKKNGVISANELERYKHIVTRSLFGSPLEEPIPIVEIRLQQGDSICISSDGLYNSINPANMITDFDGELDAQFQDFEKNSEDNFSITIITID